MPILDNSFTCPKGHKFTANAKVRARCPNCGTLTRRDFTLPEVITSKPDDKEPKERKSPLLVREGRPRLVPAPKNVPKLLTERDHQITLKRKTTTKEAPVARKQPKVPVKPVSSNKTASGIVKITRIATKGHSPQVTGKPKRTAIARHIRVPRKESFMDGVMRRFGPG